MKTYKNIMKMILIALLGILSVICFAGCSIDQGAGTEIADTAFEDASYMDQTETYDQTEAYEPTQESEEPKPNVYYEGDNYNYQCNNYQYNDVYYDNSTECEEYFVDWDEYYECDYSVDEDFPESIFGTCPEETILLCDYMDDDCPVFEIEGEDDIVMLFYALEDIDCDGEDEYMLWGEQAGSYILFLIETDGTCILVDYGYDDIEYEADYYEF